MNCNDYIIKDGAEFVRNFDTMYKEVTDPWGQEARGTEDTSFRLLVAVLKNIYSGKQMIDIGCGPGHLSVAFCTELGIKKYIGCDISKAAVEKAKSVNPELEFHELDIIRETKGIKGTLITALKTLYYCAPEIDVTIDNIHEMLEKEGYLAYSYNIKDDSFTKRFLDIDVLRSKLEEKGFRKKFLSDYFINDERIAIDVFQKI
ncbi:methyltransferase family protein [Sediminibacterium magnilacihabitans]|nr:methyltransferase family protein [Sediminibacterium magnilacihabitans]